LSANHALMDLSPRFDRVFRESDFLQSAIEEGKYGGRLHAMPVTRDCYALYWNRSAFREAGLNPDRAPVTWEEAIPLAKKLTRRSRQGTIDRLGFLPMPEDSVMMLTALGGRPELDD